MPSIFSDWLTPVLPKLVLAKGNMQVSAGPPHQPAGKHATGRVPLHASKGDLVYLVTRHFMTTTSTTALAFCFAWCCRQTQEHANTVASSAKQQEDALLEELRALQVIETHIHP